MTVFSLMVLLLTVGGVSALLWRNVFLPLRLLGDYTAQVARNESPPDFPESGTELSQLAENVRTIARQAETNSSSAVKSQPSVSP